MHDHEIIKRSKNLKFITNFTLSGCSTTVGSINWKRLENLVHLDISNIWISFEFMFNCLSRLNKNLRHLSLQNIDLNSFHEASEAYFQGSFHLMQTRCRYYLNSRVTNGVLNAIFPFWAKMKIIITASCDNF